MWGSWLAILVSNLTRTSGPSLFFCVVEVDVRSTVPSTTVVCAQANVSNKANLPYTSLPWLLVRKAERIIQVFT